MTAQSPAAQAGSLQERLRARRDLWSQDRCRWYMSEDPDSLCAEAADTIDRLTRELAAAQAAHSAPVAPELLGEVVGMHKVGFAMLATVSWVNRTPPVGTKLYAAPQRAKEQGEPT